MEWIVKAAWLSLAFLHAAPAAVFFRPALVSKLYGVEAAGDIGVLLTHRGGLFLAVVIAALGGAIDPSARRALSVVVGISMIGFLIIYARAGVPSGALQKIAVMDAIGLAPLALVLWMAWRS